MLATGPATSFVSASVLPQKEHARRAVAGAPPPRPVGPAHCSMTLIATYINRTDSRAPARRPCTRLAVDAAATGAGTATSSLERARMAPVLSRVASRKSW